MMDHWLEITSDDGEVDTINGDDDNDKYRILDDIRLPAILDDKGRRKAKKNVCWGRVAVHEHGMEMGDNPSVTDGAPVMICWQAHTTRSLTIDLYETLRPSENRRQKETDLRLGVAERAKMYVRSLNSLGSYLFCCRLPTRFSLAHHFPNAPTSDFFGPVIPCTILSKQLY